MKQQPANAVLLHLVAALMLLCALGTGSGSVHAASSRYFPETGKKGRSMTISLSYWTTHGGLLSQQGYPITDLQQKERCRRQETYLTPSISSVHVSEFHLKTRPQVSKVLLGLHFRYRGTGSEICGDSALDSLHGRLCRGGGNKTFESLGSRAIRLPTPQ